MASELRVNSSTNRSGLGTITYTDSGPIVSGVGTFTNGFTVDGTQTTVKSLKLTGDNYNANWFKTTNKLRFNDNSKATFGTADDISIYHDGSNSYLDNSNGNFEIRSNEFRVKSYSDTEPMIHASKDGTVRLYYDSGIKLATTSSGISVTGDVSVNNDTGKFLGGASNDIQLYHDGSHSVLDNLTGGLFIKGSDTTNGITLQNRNGNESLAKFIPDGAVELYHNNSKKLETTSAGASITGDVNATGNLDLTDSGRVKLGTGDDLQIYHTGSASKIDIYTTGLEIATDGTETSAKFNRHGSVELWHDGTKRFETTSTGATIIGDLFFDNPDYTGSDLLFDSSLKTLKFSDGVAAKFGTDTDMSIYHNGIHGYVSNTTGALIIQAANSNEIQLNGNGQHAAKFNPTGTSYIYYNGNLRFSIGASNTVHHEDFVPSANNTYDLGQSSYRWRNIYTNDLNLSNKGTTNSVDNTWGDYTIQEGESDLFLINNRNGKKYKFNLTEVS